jgi:hypothetical protein
MSGTVEGGKAAAETNKNKYGADFYVKIGAIGGKKGTTGGFETMAREDPVRHKMISSLAGMKGKRGKANA